MIEWFVVIGISLLFAAVNQLQVITQWLNNPPDRVFTGIAHYVTDYFLYTDLMAQGAAGSLWTAAHFTNEPMARTWIYWFNALLGFLGNLIGLSPFGTYNVSLFLLVIVLCLVWYWLVYIIFPAHNPSSPPLKVRGGRVGLLLGGEGELPFRVKRLTSWLMILTASSFSSFARPGLAKLDFSQGELLGQFWFSPTPAFNRLGGVPHQVFQTILFVLLAIVLTRKHFLVLPVLLLTGLASSANPIQMVLFIAAAMTIRSTRVIPLALVAIPVMIATNKAFELPVLAAAKAWENAQYVSVSLWQFILSMGPIALLLPFGIKPFLSVIPGLTRNPDQKKLDPRRSSPRTLMRGGDDTFRPQIVLRLLLFSYSALSILIFFSPIPKLLGTTSVRWLSPTAYGVMGILAAEGIVWIARNTNVQRIKRFRFKIWNFEFVWDLGFGIWSLLWGLYLLLTVPSLVIQIDARTSPIHNTILTSNLNHVPTPAVNALKWLKQEQVQSYTTRRVDYVYTSSLPLVVLTDPALPYDVLAPTLTGLPSFTGHPIHTLYPEVKEKLRQDFFAGSMNPDQAKQFLSDHRIGYIVTKAPAGTIIDTFPLITKAYQNDSMTIFKI